MPQAPVDYRILFDFVDHGLAKKDLLISVTGLNQGNIHQLERYLDLLRDSPYDYDCLVGLTHDDLNNIPPAINLLTINLAQLCPNNLMITLTRASPPSHPPPHPPPNSRWQSPFMLHANIAMERRKSYDYVFKLEATGDWDLDDLNSLMGCVSGLRRSINILNSRPDMAMLGPYHRLSYLDEVERESLEGFFGESLDSYAKKRDIYRDFISEYYDRDPDDRPCVLDGNFTTSNRRPLHLPHHIKPNNHFTVFDSFELPRGRPVIGEKASIRRELGEFLRVGSGSGEELPSSTHLIELIFRKERIPQFIQGGSALLIRHSLWKDFHALPLPGRFTSEWLDRALAIHSSGRNLLVGGVVGIGEAETRRDRIVPLTLMACHFRNDPVENAIKLCHLRMLMALSRSLTVIYSTENEDVRREVGESLGGLPTTMAGSPVEIRVIHDAQNAGSDLNKWMMALEGTEIKPDAFQWIWLTNDSWFGCRSLDDFLQYYFGRVDLGLVGLTDSIEKGYHLQSFSWLLNCRYVPLLLNWNRDNARSDYQTTILRNEIGFCGNVLSRMIRTDSYFHTLNYYHYNVFTDRIRLFKAIREHDFPIVKFRFLRERVGGGGTGGVRGMDAEYVRLLRCKFSHKIMQMLQ